MGKRFAKKSKNNKRKTAMLLLLITLIVILGSSLAFFSDFIIAGMTGRTGTLTLRVAEEVSLTRYWRVWTGENTEPREESDSDKQRVLANLNPGDIIEVRYTIENRGNKSAWLRNVVEFTLGENHRGVIPGTPRNI